MTDTELNPSEYTVVRRNAEGYARDVPITELDRDDLVIELAKAMRALEAIEDLSERIGFKLNDWRFG